MKKLTGVVWLIVLFLVLLGIFYPLYVEWRRETYCNNIPIYRLNEERCL